MVALVVTIVILIILATVSISSVLGENGIIKKAQQAKELHEQSKQEEQDKLDNAGEIIGDYLNGYSGGNTVLEMPSTWDKDKVTVIDDGKGTEEAKEYEDMRRQVLKYGGFYIGRFEAGINSDKLRTAETTAQKVVSKEKVAPYNYVPWGEAMNDASEVEGKSGAVYLAKNMYNTSSSVTSTLCYGCQWDAMCRYIGDSGRTTPTKSGPELTGSVSTDVSKNIYDLAGNCIEWTMEAYDTDNRTYRGGRCSSVYPVSNRYANCPPIDSYSYSFRCVLYVKQP